MVQRRADYFASSLPSTHSSLIAHVLTRLFESGNGQSRRDERHSGVGMGRGINFRMVFAVTIEVSSLGFFPRGRSLRDEIEIVGFLFTDEWTDGWMDGRTDGWIKRKIDFLFTTAKTLSRLNSSGGSRERRSYLVS